MDCTIMFWDLMERTLAEWNDSHVPAVGDFVRVGTMVYPAEVLSRTWQEPGVVILSVNVRG